MTRITRGTTNVFADLGYPDAAERQTKTCLALAVNELLKARKLKQREIGALLPVSMACVFVTRSSGCMPQQALLSAYSKF